MNTIDNGANVKNVAVVKFANTTENGPSVKTVAAVPFANTIENGPHAKNVAEVKFVNTNDNDPSVKNVAAVPFANTKNDDTRAQHVHPTQTRFVMGVHKKLLYLNAIITFASIVVQTVQHAKGRGNTKSRHFSKNQDTLLSTTEPSIRPTCVKPFVLTFYSTVPLFT